MTSPAQPGIGDAYKLHHVMGHDLEPVYGKGDLEAMSGARCPTRFRKPGALGETI
jgi:hypothetical protein